MSSSQSHPFVSRAGAKLEHAIQFFNINVAGKVCADLGCSTGGFTDCLVRRGATKVYAVDRGYGVLDARLRSDPRVTVMERTDALHVRLPEPVDVVTIDCGWTPQRQILPVALRLLKTDGVIISLIKPHYEADPALLEQGILPDERSAGVLEKVREAVRQSGLKIRSETASPVRGGAGNQEYLWWCEPL